MMTNTKKSTITIRDYRTEDYQACETLVEKAWHFSEILQPPALARVTRHLYTYGSMISSNHIRVVEDDGKLVGFLFGYNERCPKSMSEWRRFVINLGLVGKLLFVPGMPLREKFAVIGKFNRHEINRHQVEKRGASEINLFVIDAAYRGQGIGRRLLAEFADDCRQHGLERLIVEVNMAQASGFYEQCSFTKINDFESPVHAIAAEATAALYELKL